MILPTLLAALAFACYLASTALFVSLHFRGAGYSPVHHAVSDYGVGPTRRTFGAYVWLGTSGALALAAALSFAGAPGVPAWLVYVLLAMAAARSGVALFPTDLEGQRLTRTGLLHYASAILWFAAAYVFIRNGTPYLAGASGAGPVRAVLAGLAWAALPALVANCVTMARPLRRVFGLFERIFLLVVLLWFATASGAVAFAVR